MNYVSTLLQNLIEAQNNLDELKAETQKAGMPLYDSFKANRCVNSVDEYAKELLHITQLHWRKILEEVVEKGANTFIQHKKEINWQNVQIPAEHTHSIGPTVEEQRRVKNEVELRKNGKRK